MLDHHIHGSDEAVMTNHQLNQLPTAGVDELHYHNTKSHGSYYTKSVS